MSPAGEDQSGFSIAGLHNLTRIGAGGYGTVFLADDEPFGRQVAVKVLTEGVDRDAQRRFERECRAIGAVSGHPNIVPVFAAGTTATGLPYLTMQYLRGGTMADRVERDGPLAPRVVATVGVQLACALATAHAAGVLHRDVKPENVMFNEYGDAMLTDFGVAQLEGNATTTRSVPVTLLHAPPEALDGLQPDARSDVYSMGSTLYAMLAGRPAFHQPGQGVSALVRRIVMEPPPPLPVTTPEPIAAVVLRAMAKAREQRYATAVEMAEALRDAELALGWPPTPLRIIELQRSGMPPPSGPPSVSPEPPSGAADGTDRIPGATAGSGVHAVSAPTAIHPPLRASSAAGPGSGRARRRTLGVAALLLVCALVAGGLVWARQRRDASPAGIRSADGSRLTVGISEPKSVDPSDVDHHDDGGLMVIRQISEGLLELRGGLVHPLGVTGWAGSDDCTKWMFQLRDGQEFSSGEPVTARSYVDAFRRMDQGPSAVHTAIRETLVPGDGVKAEAERRLVFNLRPEAADCEFPARLTHPSIVPVPPAAGEGGNPGFRARPVGNGPYRLDSDWVPGRPIELVRNEHYRGEKRPAVDRVVLVPGNGAEQGRAYREGRLDWGAPTWNEFKALPEAEKERMVHTLAPEVVFLAVQSGEGPLANPKARQAVSLAIDRAAIASGAMRGWYEPADAFTNPGNGTPPRRNSCPYCRFDPVRARKLAAEAGLAPRTRIVLHVHPDQLDSLWVEEVGRQLTANLELDVAYVTEPDEAYLRNPAWSGLAPRYERSGYPTQRDELDDRFAGPTAGTWNRWQDPVYTATLRQARATRMPADRAKVYDQARLRLAEGLPAIPMFFQVRWRYRKVGWTNLDADRYGTVELSAVRPG